MLYSYKAIAIVGKRNTAVLVSLEDWDAIQETLYLIIYYFAAVVGWFARSGRL